MLKVHHLENSRSQRVLWALEELGLEYEVTRYDRDKKTMLAPPELRAIHPLGKSPILTDGERTLAESGAIISYLVDTYGEGRLRPSDAGDRLRNTYWMHYAEGSLMPLLLMRLVFNRIKTAPVPFFVKPIAKGIVKQVEQTFIDPQSTLHFDFIESELSRSTWFAGEDLCGADIQMSFPLEAGGSRFDLATRYPHINAFVARVHARPAYQRALARGGPYDYAGTP